MILYRNDFGDTVTVFGILFLSDDHKWLLAVQLVQTAVFLPQFHAYSDIYRNCSVQSTMHQ